MRSLDVIAPASVDAEESHVLDMQQLEQAAIDGRATLRVYCLPGEIVSLGRYHPAPAGDPTGRVCLQRRLGGGRVLPFGHGFLALSLAMPHRSALVSDDPLALRPEQVINRCTRAVLDALRTLGIDAFYPGRDRITVGGRTLAWVSLEADARGATMYEMMLAGEGDWSALEAPLAAVDPAGVLAIERIEPAQTASLERCGVRSPFGMVAQSLAEAFARVFQLGLTTAAASTAPSRVAPPAAAWLAARRLPAAGARQAAEWGQLGVFEVRLTERDARIDEIALTGDFIANSPSIEQLESGLRGCSLDHSAIAGVVERVYADPRNFLLGLGPLRAVADTIVRAA